MSEKRIVGRTVGTPINPEKLGSGGGGLAGKDGSVWYWIERHVGGEPLHMVSANAKNGDYCINTREWYVYYAENGKWVEIGNIKGDSYSLTEADKAEMVNLVLAALPTWEGGSY